MRPVTRSELSLGAVLSEKYRITREIGRGGMAAVYEAVHVQIGKKVAVKILDATLAKSPVVVERFHREARAAAAVASPYICDVYDAGLLPDGRPYLILELLEGESLYEHMCKVPRMAAFDLVRFVAQVARGLQKAHSAGIVHRDVKPENLFLIHDGEGRQVAKILDFGLAKFVNPAADTDDATRITREGAIFGTPMYMSPEQVKGQGQADPRSDLWALACIVFECLLGRPVWKIDQGAALIFAQIAAARAPVPSHVDPTMPRAFDDWMTKALARDPADRFQTAAEFSESLGIALGVDAPVSSPIASSVRRRPASDFIELHPSEPSAPYYESPPSSPSHSTAPAPASRPRLAHSSTVAPHPSLPLGILVPSVALLCVVSAAAAFALVRGISGSTAAQGEPAPAASSAVPAVAIGNPVPAPSNSTQEPAAGLDGAMLRAQQFIAQGKHDDAVRELEQASRDAEGSVFAALLEHERVAQAAVGNCKVTGLSHPRPRAWTSVVRQPTLAIGPDGPAVIWLDNEPQKSKWEARGVLLGSALEPLGAPVSVSSASVSIDNVALIRTADRLVLSYGGGGDGTAWRGAYVRLLDGHLNPAGDAQRLSASRAGAERSSIAPLASGSFLAAFADAAAEGPSDVILQGFLSGVTPSGSPVRITTYAAQHADRIASVPALAVSSERAIVAWRRESPGGQAIVVRASKVADGTPAWPAGSDPDGTVVSDQQGRLREPQLACGKNDCFVTWRSDPYGSNVAVIDPSSGTLRWRKAFAPRGAQIAVAAGQDGAALIAWFDAGRVKIARVDDDGVGEATLIAKVTGDPSSPSIVALPTAGQWLIAWISMEAARTEAFVARVVCSP